jgi:excinuclease ABC subunit C
VSAAKGVLAALGLSELPVAGLAKRNEEIFLPGRRDPITLPEGDPALKILQYVRDETHRFATGFNKKLRQKDSSFSIIDSVPGIGPARSRKLIEAFGSLEMIGKASAEELKNAAGIPPATAVELLKKINEK